MPSHDPLRTYVLVRRDLPRTQRAVQAGHALAELTFRAGVRMDPIFQKWVKEDKTLVILGVPNEETLKDFHQMVETRKMIHAEFREPDLNNEATALAIYPMKESEVPSEFSSLPLA